MASRGLFHTTFFYGSKVTWKRDCDFFHGCFKATLTAHVKGIISGCACQVDQRTLPVLWIPEGLDRD